MQRRPCSMCSSNRNHDERRRCTFASASRMMQGRFALAAAALGAFLLAASVPARAQATLSPEEARTLEYGKEIYKIKANCQYCHKWDASGDTGYGGVALSLRKTRLNPEQFAEVIKCGRPATGMPYHDQYAYTDKRCYGLTREDLGKNMPLLGESLNPREVDAVVKYLFAKAVGHGESTYEDCVDFWGKDTRQCEPMKK
jgi:mono/diheme cytochrome c family protein